MDHMRHCCCQLLQMLRLLLLLCRLLLASWGVVGVAVMAWPRHQHHHHPPAPLQTAAPHDMCRQAARSQAQVRY
jgi:hypothetical protein